MNISFCNCLIQDFMENANYDVLLLLDDECIVFGEFKGYHCPIYLQKCDIPKKLQLLKIVSCL